MDITKIQDELEDRADDEEEKDTSDETEGEGSTDNKSEDDEAGENSECESIATIDYEFPEDKNEAKAKSEDMKNNITETENKGRKEPIDRDTEKAEYNTNLEKNNVVERITFQKSPQDSN